MRIEDVGKLRELARWLLKRVWPGSKPVLEAAFLTYRTVLVDLLNELEANSVTVGSAGAEALEVEKFYKQFPTYDPEQYAVLMQKFDRAVYTVEDLGIELTRAANLVADTVRETLSPRYRRAEGYVAICSGPAITGHGELTGSMTTVYQYPRSVDPATAYRGLAAVKAAAAERASRDA
jgi:hypothetical protein